MSHGLKTAIAGLLLLVGGVLFVLVLRGRSSQTYRAPDTFREAHLARVAKYAPETRTRCEAIARLANTPTQGDGKSDAIVVPALLQTLDDPNPSVAASAAQALGKRREPAAVQPLIRRLNENRPGLLTFSAIKALERIGDPAALETLQRVVEKAGELAPDAALAIGRLRDRRTGKIPQSAEDALIRYLSSPIPKVRQGALYGLREGGTRRALGPLKKLLADPFAGLDPKIVGTPLPEIGLPHPSLLGEPCQEAIEAIEVREGIRPPVARRKPSP